MTIRILVGDCRVRLREFPDNFFHTCVTSWPYWGLRDYGIPPTVWGGDPQCQHVWAMDVVKDRHYDKGTSTLSGPNKSQMQQNTFEVEHGFCQRCGAWLGNFGLEPTPDLYIQHGVEISREVRRVLRDDGTMWLNLGDCYAGSGPVSQAQTDNDIRHARVSHALAKRQRRVGTVKTLKPKDLVGIPWAVAFALRDDGWWLRQAIPWIKDNPMPESVDDRPGVAHEYLFLFSKSKRYYYDKVAIFEPSSMSEASQKRAMYPRYRKSSKRDDDEGKPDFITDPDKGNWPPTRNRRTADWWRDSLDYLIEYYDEYVLHLKYIKEHGGMLLDPDGQPLGLMVNPEGFAGDHYATFPTRLVEPCLKASTSERGACPECGTPWERVAETSGGSIGKSWHDHKDDTLIGQRTCSEAKGGHDYSRKTIGWRPTCTCYDDRYRSEFPRARSARKRWQQDMANRWWPRVRQRLGKDEWPTVPCRVLDHMGGAGTTAMVADRLGLDAISIDIKPEYGQMGYDRIEEDAGPMFAQVTLEEEQ